MESNASLRLNKDGKIQYVLLKGEPGHPDAEARTKYVIEQLNAKGIQTEQLLLILVCGMRQWLKIKWMHGYLALKLTKLK